MWAPKIALLYAAYPYRVVCTIGNHAGGVAILSLRPFADGTEGRCIEGGTFADGVVRFRRPAARYRGAAPALAMAARPVGADRQTFPATWPGFRTTALLAGDLNATPWSATRRADRRRRRAAAGRPVGVTWLYRLLPEFLRFAGLPIDQVFAKGERSRAFRAATLEAAGSDHLPVLVEFSLPARSCIPTRQRLRSPRDWRPKPADLPKLPRSHPAALTSASISRSTRPPSRCSRLVEAVLPRLIVGIDRRHAALRLAAASSGSPGRWRC